MIDCDELKSLIVGHLKNIYDPEIPVNIYDLGLIYAIECSWENDHFLCKITMTLTSSACPVSESIVEQVRSIQYLLDRYAEVVIEPNLVFDPPWSMESMSDEAKLQLGML